MKTIKGDYLNNRKEFLGRACLSPIVNNEVMSVPAQKENNVNSKMYTGNAHRSRSGINVERGPGNPETVLLGGQSVKRVETSVPLACA